MSAVEYRFLEPLDVLFLRGNKLFGDPGSFGESLVPPWPSVAAGALRSRLLADDGVDPAAFGAGAVEHPSLGTPARPGAFAVTSFHLARRDAEGRVETLVAPPADLIVTEDEVGNCARVRTMQPTPPSAGPMSSAPFTRLPVLAQDTRDKAAGGYWLTEAGWRKYLAGGVPRAADLVKSRDLWAIDARVGVGLDESSGRAADGRLFSVQAVAMRKREHDSRNGFDAGFLCGVSGAMPPRNGTLRLGGDGRAAAIHPAAYGSPEPDYDAILRDRRCRLVLTAPGIFPGGWRLAGSGKDGVFSLAGVKARVVCAAVPGAEVISGWDLANWQPKSARRAAPAGSVYWLEDIEADPRQLRKLADGGLWSEPCEDPQRRAEGFNRFMFSVWL